ncbi:MAG: hypothetical protein QXL15_00830 [Candidatus Korarchaeota archaeon]
MAEEDIYVYTTKVLAKIVSKIEEMENMIHQLIDSINSLRETQRKLTELLGKGFETIFTSLGQKHTQTMTETTEIFNGIISRLQNISTGTHISMEKLTLVLSSFNNNLNKILLLHQLMEMFENLNRRIEEAKAMR